MSIFKGNGAPTTATPGFVGDIYLDVDTLTFYKCTKVEPAKREMGFVTTCDYALATTKYTWEAVATE